MRFAKALCLAAVAALAAMAFVGAGSASAAHGIVICKQLVTGKNLCPDNNLFPSGTLIFALAENPELKASGVPAVKCEDSEVVAKTTSEMASPLGISITGLEFGSLPTPLLGNGCTTCTSGVHTAPPYAGSISMTTENDYTFTASGSAELLNCFGLGVNCAYGESNISSLVDPDSGKHKKSVLAEEKGLATILINASLKRTGGSFLCPGTGTWTANYVVYAVGASAADLLAGYIALDE